MDYKGKDKSEVKIKRWWLRNRKKSKDFDLLVAILELKTLTYGEYTQLQKQPSRDSTNLILLGQIQLFVPFFPMDSRVNANVWNSHIMDFDTCMLGEWELLLFDHVLSLFDFHGAADGRGVLQGMYTKPWFTGKEQLYPKVLRVSILLVLGSWEVCTCYICHLGKEFLN